MQPSQFALPPPFLNLLNLDLPSFTSVAIHQEAKKKKRIAPAIISDVFEEGNEDGEAQHNRLRKELIHYYPCIVFFMIYIFLSWNWNLFQK